MSKLTRIDGRDHATLTRTRAKRLSHDQTEALLREYAELAACHGAESPHAIRVRNRLVEGHLGLVFSVWQRGYAQRIPQDDALGIGAQGLMKAVERFDLSRGTRFSTYAVWWIRHSLSRTHADEGSLIRIPVHAQTQARKGVGCTLEDVRAARQVCSLDASVDGEEAGRTPFRDLLPDVEAIDALEEIGAGAQIAALRDALALLSPRQRAVLEQRADGHNYAAIAADIGLTCNDARQLEQQGLARLRRALSA